MAALGLGAAGSLHPWGSQHPYVPQEHLCAPQNLLCTPKPTSDPKYFPCHACIPTQNILWLHRSCLCPPLGVAAPLHTWDPPKTISAT